MIKRGQCNVVYSVVSRDSISCSVGKSHLVHDIKRQLSLSEHHLLRWSKSDCRREVSWDDKILLQILCHHHR